MSLQYLDTLKTIGGAASTKLLVPVEFTNLMRPFLDHTAEASARR